MTLRQLLSGITETPVAAVPIRGISCHSKSVRPGDLFVAVEGPTVDGHAYIAEAVEKGAAAIIAQKVPQQYWQHHEGKEWSRACPCIVVKNTKHALAVIAARFYGHPVDKLRLIGITGTNGKTTTSFLVKSALEAAGERSGLLGTLYYQVGSRRIPSKNTTPSVLDLQRYFAQMAGEEIPWCSMEVSSHALAQERIEGVNFDVAVFCNLGNDHLDYHKTLDAYAAAKRKLFDHLKPDGTAVINVDDDYGKKLAKTLGGKNVITYGMETPARVAIKDISSNWRGIHLLLESPWGEIPLESPLLGRFNVWNVAAAAIALLAVGVSPQAVQQGIAGVSAVPGRLEPVPNETGIQILIDYAHTADALRLVLLSVRELIEGRLIVVFGCGGDRDKGKRAVMGRLASLLADEVVLTADNPRSENPADINEQVRSGFAPGFENYRVIADREEAIVSALSMAEPGDTVLIAGKGHESYQVFDNITVPFSDAEVVRRWIDGFGEAGLAAAETAGFED